MAGLSAGHYIFRGRFCEGLGFGRVVIQNHLIGREGEDLGKIHTTGHAAVELGEKHPPVLEAPEDADEGWNPGERQGDLGLGRGSDGGVGARRQVEFNQQIRFFALKMEPVFKRQRFKIGGADGDASRGAE